MFSSITQFRLEVSNTFCITYPFGNLIKPFVRIQMPKIKYIRLQRKLKLHFIEVQLVNINETNL